MLESGDLMHQLVRIFENQGIFWTCDCREKLKNPSVNI